MIDSGYEPLLRGDSGDCRTTPNFPKSPPTTVSNESLRAPRRIFDSRKYHRLTVEQVNTKKMSLYYRDIFHTLVNMPNYRFLLLFVGSYFSMYAIFAFMYMTQPKHCVSNVNQFSHALWFSVHTAATIGYGHQAPDPDCILVNTIIMVQVMAAALMQAALLGLVYARFSSPGSRAATIKFSSILTLHKGGDGYGRLAFRVANLRRHQVLQPEVHMLLMRKDHAGGRSAVLEYQYYELSLTHVTGKGRLWLGVPTIMAHTIDESSPIWGVSRQELESSDIEFVVLLDGVDETTSTVMQARHSYFPSDIRWDEQFAGVLARGVSGVLTADYSHFDLTRLLNTEETETLQESQSAAEAGTFTHCPTPFS